MAGLLYYLPNEPRGIRIERIHELGLGYAFEDRRTPCGCQHGPDGGSGVVIADERCVPSHLVGYFPERQQWLKIPGMVAYVGFYPADRPKPADLARTQQLRGHLVKLRDGQEYEIPVARALSEDNGELLHYCRLPAGTSIDEQGNWIRGALAPAEARLWEIAERFYLAFSTQFRTPADEEEQPAEAPTTITLDFAGENDAALAALAHNYRVGKAEVALLGLFDNQAIGGILQALIDWPTFIEFLKKKLAPTPVS